MHQDKRDKNQSLGSIQKSWITGHSIQLFSSLGEFGSCFYVCLFCFVLFLSAHSVLNWVVVAKVYVDCHSKYSLMFLLAPRVLGFARFHQSSEKGKLEASPLNSPQKTCGFGCLEQLFSSPGWSRQLWFLCAHSVMSQGEQPWLLATQAPIFILRQVARLC